MDGNRFDDLSRRLATGMSRRVALSGLAGGLAGAIGLRRLRRADAQVVTPAQCGNVSCKNNPGKCTDGCVCCLYPNGNSRCRPPQDCAGTVVTTTTTTSTTPAPTTTTSTPEPTTTTTTTAPTTTTTAPPCVPKTCQGEGKNCGTISDGCGKTLVCGECVRFSGRRCIDNVCHCPRGNTPCPNDCSCFDVIDQDDDVCVDQLIGGIVECTSSAQCASNEVCIRITSTRPGTCNILFPCTG